MLKENPKPDAREGCFSWGVEKVRKVFPPRNSTGDVTQTQKLWVGGLAQPKGPPPKRGYRQRKKKNSKGWQKSKCC